MALSPEDIARLEQKLDEGDRGGVYWEYYKLTGEYQSIVQGQITTYSGTWGGMAMVGNYLAKLADQKSYTLTLDQFSAAIISGTLEAVRSDEDGILNKVQMQESDYETWNSRGMGELFPGNMQFAMSIEGWLFHRDKISTEGTGNSLWMGIQNIDIFSDEDYKPEELGNRFDEFQGERYEKIDLAGHPESDGRFLRVIDKQTGHLVFMQDTQPPEPFSSWIEVDIPGKPTIPLPGVGITWGLKTTGTRFLQILQRISPESCSRPMCRQTKLQEPNSYLIKFRPMFSLRMSLIMACALRQMSFGIKRY